MDIGKEKRVITVEPVTSPVPAREPAPEPIRAPVKAPVKPEREKVGA